MSRNWTSNSPEFKNDGFPEPQASLWLDTARRFTNGNLDPVFGKDQNWYFWDETWTDAFGPYETQEAARKGCLEYASNL